MSTSVLTNGILALLPVPAGVPLGLLLPAEPAPQGLHLVRGDHEDPHPHRDPPQGHHVPERDQEPVLGGPAEGLLGEVQPPRRDHRKRGDGREGDPDAGQEGGGPGPLPGPGELLPAGDPRAEPPLDRLGDRQSHRTVPSTEAIVPMALWPPRGRAWLPVLVNRFTSTVRILRHGRSLRNRDGRLAVWSSPMRWAPGGGRAWPSPPDGRRASGRSWPGSWGWPWPRGVGCGGPCCCSRTRSAWGCRSC